MNVTDDRRICDSKVPNVMYSHVRGYKTDLYSVISSNRIRDTVLALFIDMKLDTTNFI